MLISGEEIRHGSHVNVWQIASHICLLCTALGILKSGCIEDTFTTVWRIIYSRSDPRWGVVMAATVLSSCSFDKLMQMMVPSVCEVNESYQREFQDYALTTLVPSIWAVQLLIIWHQVKMSKFWDRAHLSTSLSACCPNRVPIEKRPIVFFLMSDIKQ